MGESVYLRIITFVNFNVNFRALYLMMNLVWILMSIFVLFIWWWIWVC